MSNILKLIASILVGGVVYVMAQSGGGGSTQNVTSPGGNTVTNGSYRQVWSVTNEFLPGFPVMIKDKLAVGTNVFFTPSYVTAAPKLIVMNPNSELWAHFGTTGVGAGEAGISIGSATAGGEIYFNSSGNMYFNHSDSAAVITLDIADSGKAAVRSSGFSIGPASTPIVADYSATAALDFGSIAAGASEDLTITVTGATDSAACAVALRLPTAPTAGIIYQAFVSAANTVTVRATNITLISVDPSSQTIGVIVFKL